MVLDLNSVLRGEQRTVSFSFSMIPHGMPTDLNDVSANVTGLVEDHSGYMLLKADIAVSGSAVCGRCGITFPYGHTFKMESGVSRDEVEADLEDEYLIAPDGLLDLDEAVNTFLIITLPYRFLCSSNCKGLCQKCGKNLNEGACDCKTAENDPRWDVLKNYFDK